MKYQVKERRGISFCLRFDYSNGRLNCCFQWLRLQGLYWDSWNTE